jgi:hypothetical protein
MNSHHPTTSLAPKADRRERNMTIKPVDSLFSNQPLMTKRPSTAESTNFATQLTSSFATRNQMTDKASSVEINGKLTDKDKALVVAATGQLQPISATGVRALNPLAIQIALDREIGSLSGEIDKTYINNLMATQTMTRQDTIPFAALSKALAYLTA